MPLVARLDGVVLRALLDTVSKRYNIEKHIRFRYGTYFLTTMELPLGVYSIEESPQGTNVK